MNGMIVKRGDMFSAVFDGVKSEQQGLRPFIVLQNNIGNKFSPTLVVALITTKNKNTSVDIQKYCKMIYNKLYE